MVHPSHKQLMLYRGVFFCRCCGTYGATRILKLSHPCGKLVHGPLARLEKGLLPAGLKNWPDLVVKGGGAELLL